MLFGRILEITEDTVKIENISGKVQKIHKNKREAKSEILTAAVDFSIDKIILTKTYPKNKVPGNRTDVKRLIFNQFIPFIIL